MGTIVNIHEAKTHFSRLINRVIGGEEIIIAKNGTPVVKLVAAGPTRECRVAGLDRGLISITPDFDEELPEDLLADFEKGRT